MGMSDPDLAAGDRAVLLKQALARIVEDIGDAPGFPLTRSRPPSL
jgi:hypothetical protein